MADLTLVTANQVQQAEIHTIQHSLPLAANSTAGNMVRQDDNGLWAKASADTAANSKGLYGMLAETNYAGYTVTAYRYARIDGFDISAMAPGDPVYLSDTPGLISSTPGTIPIVVGRVIAVWGQSLGAAPDMIIELDVAPGSESAFSTETDNGVVITSELLAASVDKFIFVADRAYRVGSVKEIHSVIGGSGATVRPRKIAAATVAAPGAAVAAGIVELTSAAIGLETTVNTTQAGTLSATAADLLLAAGDKIALDFAGTLTGLVGSITIALDPV